MAELGTDLILVCSAVAPDAVDDVDLLAAQLHGLAERAEAHGMRIAYEALAWGTRISTYEQSWDAVRRADHPALGLCLDSFHILSRGSDPAGIEDIPAEKLFFLQLADAPHMNMDVLQWSRHHRLFPGQGAFDLPAFLGHVLAAGYTGPLSLEVFNDVFRQSDPRRAAVDARRSLLALREATAPHAGVGSAHPPPTPELHGFAFTEIAVDADVRGGRSARCSPPRLRATPVSTAASRCSCGSRATPGWCSTSRAPTGRRSSALGIETADPTAAAGRADGAARAAAAAAPRPAEADLLGVTAPDGTAIFFCHSATEGVSWLADFLPTGTSGPAGDGHRTSTTSR